MRSTLESSLAPCRSTFQRLPHRREQPAWVRCRCPGGGRCHRVESENVDSTRRNRSPAGPGPIPRGPLPGHSYAVPGAQSGANIYRVDRTSTGFTVWFCDLSGAACGRLLECQSNRGFVIGGCVPPPGRTRPRRLVKPESRRPSSPEMVHENVEKTPKLGGAHALREQNPCGPTLPFACFQAISYSS